MTYPSILRGIAIAAAIVAGAGAYAFTAAPLPDPRIPGYHFPEPEATVLGWVTDMASGSATAQSSFNSAHLHGWGLWTALTAETAQSDNDGHLRVFETWYTPQELSGQSLLNPGLGSGGAARLRSTITGFRQFRAQGDRLNASSAPAGGSETVFGYVKFDPTAAAHIASQGLLSASTLGQLLLGGAQQIPVFPQTAIALKSAFQVITRKTLVGGRYYRLNAWTGPPATPQAWPPFAWPGVVWIDVLGGGHGAGQVDFLASTDGGSRTEATTYPVTSLINHRLSTLEALEFNMSDPTAGAEAGDYAVLVAMHVAGREIDRWTWQTFWWSPTPADPQLPSSAAIAALRPRQLSGAARNYAMALGYEMLTPGQPNVGGRNEGAAIYAYNPYLEARFGPANLPDSIPGSDPSGQPAANNTGVTCNCMSCHIRSNYNPGGLSTAPGYAGARYTDINDPQFAGTLQVDFLWSIAELAN